MNGFAIRSPNCYVWPNKTGSYVIWQIRNLPLACAGTAEVTATPGSATINAIRVILFSKVDDPPSRSMDDFTAELHSIRVMPNTVWVFTRLLSGSSRLRGSY